MQHSATEFYVKAQRLAAGARLSITALCRHAGVAPATAVRWKNGSATPSMRIWSKLEAAAKAAAERLNCPHCGSDDTEAVDTDAHRTLRACCACMKVYEPAALQ